MAHIAPELWDNILDHCHDDHVALRACCLVCRAWLPTARLHLFSGVQLYNESVKSCRYQGYDEDGRAVYPNGGGHIHWTLNQFVNLIESPLFSFSLTRIHNLSIHISEKTSRKNISRDLSLISSYACQERMPLVTSMTLRELQMGDMLVNIIPTSHFTSLTALNLVKVGFKDISQLCEIIQSQPALLFLFVSGCQYRTEITAEQISRHITGPASLDSVDLFQQDEDTILLQWLSRSLTRMKLASLKYPDSTEQYTGFKAFLGAVRLNQLYLEIDHSSGESPFV
ncbi:hypothetical protein C8J56DRAFT_1056186 [Mycena floridula]|nr:hypothetical protein C8J56DRAFT_1056186 [Mycena floridula]